MECWQGSWEERREKRSRENEREKNIKRNYSRERGGKGLSCKGAVWVVAGQDWLCCIGSSLRRAYLKGE